MMQIFASQTAKDVVHEALKQPPSVIPWFIGIYDDWTIGHFKCNPKTNHITFRSENFSEKRFYDICCFISEQIEKEIHPEFIIQYANFNNESGRLVVKNFIEAVTDLIMDESVKHDDSYDSHNSNKSNENINHYYKVLDIQPSASLKDIKQAYRNLATVWHPDRFSQNTQLQKMAEEKLKEINEAYEKIMIFLEM